MSVKPDRSTQTAHLAWDERWRSEAGRGAWLTPAPEVVEILPTLQQRGARRVLDLGCGVGRHVLLFARAGFEVFGLDASEGGIRHTREAAVEAGVDVDLRVGMMTDLPYADGSFDYVLAFNVIYHGHPGVVQRTTDEIHRVLRRGGPYQGTMLSKRNTHYGTGDEVARDTFVKGAGDKAHPHFYCNAWELVALFHGFELLSLTDRPQEEPGSWHWYVIAEQAALRS